MVMAFLLTFLVGLMVALVALAVGVGLVVRSIAHRNRLHPSIDTGAPLLWCWSPGAPARLHRRLQGALAPIHEPDPVLGTAEMVSVLAEQAAAVDRDLVTASRYRGPVRRSRLRGLRTDVRQLEQLSSRLQQQRALLATVGPAAGPARQDVFHEVQARLDLLADAHAELLALEEASAASDPDAVLRRIAPVASVPRRPARPVGRGPQLAGVRRPVR